MFDVDVLFVNPGDRKQIYQDLGEEFCAIEPPVFAGLFATYARRQGLSCAILDGPALGLSAEQIAARIEEANPGLVAIVVYGFQPSASTQNMTAAGNIASFVKRLNPERKILMTGTHPAALPAQTLAEEDVDFVVDSEGPVTIANVAAAIKAGRRDFSLMPSLWWKRHGATTAPAAREPLLKDLDAEMPGIAWDLLDMSRYRAHNWHAFAHVHDRAPYAAIHTSLGCPYRCNFCCINAPFGSASYRMWSPERVVNEIDFLVEHYGVKNIKFVDEMFVLNPRHVLGICDLLIERDYEVNIWAYARVDTVRDAFLDKLKRAGFNWLCLGIEAANSTVRDGADKEFSDESILDTCRRIQSHGINIIANYIFGLPEDTHERMQQTLDMALEINAEFANFYSAMAYPGSPLYAMAVDKGYQLPEKWHHYSQHGYQSKPLRNEYLTSAEILRFRDQAWQTYFSHPPYLALLERKFGRDVVEHVSRMRAVPLSRALLETGDPVGAP
jgi:anaerobic magnesium-protoporphyrin IX monomethyl ester cyclase